MAERLNLADEAPRIRAEVPRHHVPCNLCGSELRVPFCPENGRGLVKCQACGLVYVSPRPDPTELYALYGESYFRNSDSGTVGYTNYLRDETNIRKTFQRRLKRIERFTPPGALLDIGCATGFFLATAQERGWRGQGLDVSHFAVNYAREQLGLDVQQGSLLELDYPANHYDLITMWDVIEHVPDPKAYVQRASALLKPGGLFALATPDLESFPARLTGRRWVGYKLSEEHVYYFSLRTLIQLLDNAGMDVIDHYHVGKYVTFSLFMNRLSMYTPLLARAGQWLESRLHLSEWSLYVNPLDIIAITARKRG